MFIGICCCKLYIKQIK
ncbi:hypothetical protein WG66_006561, partial [Moniliophthora roreri]